MVNLFLFTKNIKADICCLRLFYITISIASKTSIRMSMLTDRKLNDVRRLETNTFASVTRNEVVEVLVRSGWIEIPSGNLLHSYWKWSIYSGFTHWKRWSSIVFCMFTRGYPWWTVDRQKIVICWLAGDVSFFSSLLKGKNKKGLNYHRSKVGEYFNSKAMGISSHRYSMIQSSPRNYSNLSCWVAPWMSGSGYLVLEYPFDNIISFKKLLLTCDLSIKNSIIMCVCVQGGGRYAIAIVKTTQCEVPIWFSSWLPTSPTSWW